MQEKEQLKELLEKLKTIQGNVPESFTDTRSKIKSALDMLYAAQLGNFGCVKLHENAASLIKAAFDALSDLDFATRSSLHQDQAMADAAATALFGYVFNLTTDTEQETNKPKKEAEKEAKEQKPTKKPEEEKIDGETITKWTNLFAPLVSIVLGILFACHVIPNFFHVNDDTLYYLLGELVSFGVSFVTIFAAHLINKYGRKGYYEAMSKKYTETGVRGFVQRNFIFGNVIKSGPDSLNVIGGRVVSGGDPNQKEEGTQGENIVANNSIHGGPHSINIIGGSYSKKK